MAKKETMKADKPSYEQLEAACKELVSKCNQALAQLRKAEEYIAGINRLDYLFKVMETSKEYSQEFVNTVAKEIEDALTVKDSESAKVVEKSDTPENNVGE